MGYGTERGGGCGVCAPDSQGPLYLTTDLPDLLDPLGGGRDGTGATVTPGGNNTWGEGLTGSLH